MAEIAARLGVAQSTVSRALRGDPRISAAQQERVRAAAAESAYSPHPAVSTLMAMRRRRGVSAVEGLALVDPFLSPVAWRTNFQESPTIRGAARRAVELGYRVDYFTLMEPGMTPRRLGQVLRARGIRGVVFGPWLDPVDMEGFPWERFASVALETPWPGLRLPLVAGDNRAAAALALEQLARRGYRRPGLVVRKPDSARLGHAWLSGYLQGCHVHGLERVEVCDWTGDSSVEAWLVRERPDAVLSYLLPVVEQLKTRRGPRPAYVHLGQSEKFPGVAYATAGGEDVGQVAVDAVVAQLHRNELGLPRYEVNYRLGAVWDPGDLPEAASCKGAKGGEGTGSKKRGDRN